MIGESVMNSRYEHACRECQAAENERKLRIELSTGRGLHESLARKAISYGDAASSIAHSLIVMNIRALEDRLR